MKIAERKKYRTIALDKSIEYLRADTYKELKDMLNIPHIAESHPKSYRIERLKFQTHCELLNEIISE